MTAEPDATITLADAFPLEQARCRELLEQYKDIGAAGQFGHWQIGEVLKRADRAAISGGVVEMLRAFGEMKGCK